MRSAKKPTAVSAATASVTATTRRRSSPARKSRPSWRQPSCHAEGERGAARAGDAIAAGDVSVESVIERGSYPSCERCVQAG
jgi:hypothetical protein